MHIGGRGGQPIVRQEPFVIGARMADVAWAGCRIVHGGQVTEHALDDLQKLIERGCLIPSHVHGLVGCAGGL